MMFLSCLLLLLTELNTPGTPLSTVSMDMWRWYTMVVFVAFSKQPPVPIGTQLSGTHIFNGQTMCLFARQTTWIRLE